MPPTVTPAATYSDTHHAVSRLVLFTLCACVMAAQSMVAAVNLAIPKLAASTLQPTAEQQLWIVDAYVIVFAALLIPAGALGDRYGRRGALLSGLGLFSVGAITSALAPHAAVLIAGRALSGAGAALIMPATMSILVQLSGTPQARAKALAAWTLSVGLGGALGNIGSGLLQQYLPWQALFWAIAPITAALTVLVWRVTPRTPRRAASPDPIGTVLLTAGSTAILYGIIEGPGDGWTAPAVLAGFATGALLLAAMVIHSRRVPHPLVDPGLFRSHTLRVALLGTAASFFGLFALFFVNAQYLQIVKGFSAAPAGLAVLPVTVGMILVPRLAVRIEARIGPRLPAAGGLAVLGISLLVLATASAATPYPVYALYLLVLSAGFGLCAPVLTGGVVTGLPREQSGLGAGLNTAAREFGAALGVAVIGVALGAHAGHRLDAVAFTDGMGRGLGLIGAVVLLAAAVVAIGLRPSRTHGSAGHHQPRATGTQPPAAPTP
ncbi:MFS transporter [Nocardia sp. R6R-6]|uniref:MFS transporter n=1 Tax=Nocardia sp. R6R-6 TaxID=3459303 RepID=UPI00403D83D4